MKLILDDICMRYGKKEVLYNINYKFDTGIYGLLGPNGAGKSTLINIIVGLILPDKGQVFLDDIPIEKLKDNYFEHIGYMPQYAGYYNNFTVYEMMDYFSVLKGIKKNNRKNRIYELLDFVNMKEKTKTKMGACSGGMKQRVGIAIALLNNPEVVILDEPTAGLDPMERIRFRNMISGLGTDKTVIISTHIVSDIENIANKIILLSRGNIIKSGAVAELCDGLKNRVWVIKSDDDEMMKKINHNYNVCNIYSEESVNYIRVLSDSCPEIGDNVKNMNPQLEDVYLYYFGEKVIRSAEI